MTSQNVSVPKGMRDFSPEEMLKRNYIFNIIKNVFETFGYMQIETPAMENLTTLSGKYGNEGDKLIFKVLNSGNFMNAIDKDIHNYTYQQLSNLIAEKGLKYDLTVPFARYVVQHRNEIVLPFKRYQIQPVWRADKPQKGRYREFFQCDADIIGSNSLINEFELLQMSNEIFDKLGIKIEIRLNNRKILMGMANLIDNPQLLTDITIAIDKVDKIGIDKAMEDLALKGLNEESVLKIQNIIKLKGNNETKIKQLKRIFVNYTEAIQGIEELEMILKYNEYQSLSCPVILDLSLARGLNYYTGTIIEIKATQVNIGSISGGGRYDNLTGIFGLPDISGVGISFGADRIADVMNELSLFPSYTETSTKIMFVNFGKKEELFCIQKLKQLREHGICCELYPDNVKIKKQMSYANARKIPYVVLAGESEINNTNGKLTVKDMSTGTEKLMTTDEIIKMISDNQNKL